MFVKLKLQILIIFTVIFCACLSCEAVVLDPIAASDFVLTKDAIIVPIEKLRPSEKVTREEIEEAMKFIELSKIGKAKKREPLSVIERGDGSYTIIDGNKTFAAMKELGAKNLPVIVRPHPYQKDVENIKDLYALNLAAEDEYNKLMAELQAELGGELLKRPQIKSEKRVREKAKLEYDGDYSAITDLWAATLVYPDEESLLAAFDELKKRDDVIWINDRWNNPLPQGYKDIQLNLILSNGAICELQLHHKAVMEVNNGLDHYIYEFRRANMDNPEMKNYVERAFNFQKVLYESVWDGRFAELDESVKKLLEKTAKQLSMQKSSQNADLYLKRLERILQYNLSEKKVNVAA
ncbi:MAG: ParB N-terminal domain-containing protein [Selenomonadaceae bacterium]|nr:ParB N-terminal domain-containing protein [Selenomonadaceae bacterium]